MNLELLQHSPFLQALGVSILHSLWQTFIIWVIYKLISQSVKQLTSNGRYLLSTYGIFASFVWFVYTLVITVNQVTAVAQGVPAENPALATVSGNTLFLFAASAVQRISAFMPYLSLGYIFLLIFLGGKLVISFYKVHNLTHSNLLEPPENIAAFTMHASHRMGIKRKILVWISETISVPATTGLFKPVILIPVASLNNLSPDQLEAIILHELAHIRRNDYFINAIISVIETILFFNPFIVLLSRVMKQERENCCDDNVIIYRYDPHSYASALLTIAQSFNGKPQLAVAALSGKKQLFSRIKRITGKPLENSQLNYGQRLLALLVISMVIFSVSWITPATRVNHTRQTEGKPVVTTIEKTVKKSDLMSNIGNLGEVLVENIQRNMPKQITITAKTDDLKSASTQLSATIPNTLRKELGKALKEIDKFHLQKQGFFDFKVSDEDLKELKNIPLDLVAKYLPGDFKIDIDAKKINESATRAMAFLAKGHGTSVNAEIPREFYNTEYINLLSDQIRDEELQSHDKREEKRFKKMLLMSNDKVREWRRTSSSPDTAMLAFEMPEESQLAFRGEGRSYFSVEPPPLPETYNYNYAYDAGNNIDNIKAPHVNKEKRIVKISEDALIRIVISSDQDKSANCVTVKKGKSDARIKSSKDKDGVITIEIN